jgi:amino acid adenylation domain-containing protein
MALAGDTTLSKTIGASRLTQRLQSSRAQQIRIEPKAERRYSPFPLADMQHAYWMGRQTTFSHAGAIQFYAQYHCPALDLDRLEAAWNAVIARHDMLRASIGPDGLQIVSEHAPHQSIGRGNLMGLSSEAQQQALAEVQRRMQEECVPLDQWPQSRIHFDALDEEGQGYLHIKLDLWNVDGRSLHILLDEMAQFYLQPDLQLPPLQMQFCDYIAALQEQEASPRYRRALERWTRKLKELPAAPALPRSTEAGDHRFRRWTGTLDSSALTHLNASARQRGLSLATVILTVYAATLARWSATPHFTLNVPRFNRPDWHPDIGNVIGEFASFSLLEVDLRESTAFAANASRLQTQLWEDLDYQEVSGIRQLRELARLQRLGEAAAMPIVFTTTPELRDGAGLRPHEIGAVFGEPVCVVSRTPQVLLDCQYLVDDGQLLFNWDAMPSAFPNALLDDMFDAFSRSLKLLAEDDSAWNRPLQVSQPPSQLAARALTWNEVPVSGRTAPHALRAQARQAPQSTAVISAQGECLTYEQLLAQVTTLAQHMLLLGVQRADRVALLTQRGWQQAVALLACQWLGAVAVPLDRGQPANRLQAILDRVAPKLVLSNVLTDKETLSGRPHFLMPEHPQPASFVDTPPALFDANAVCLVIFTSGSTGQPKGVEICQGAIANFLEYSLRSFALRATDRIISITAQHHDLALFDQLATFCAGACLIVPDASRDVDPSHWLELMHTHHVSIWNSVPRFMEMVAAEARAQGGSLPPSLRQVILGGDWVSPSLAAYLLEHPELQLRSIGGPTETVVWNVTHEVNADDTSLPSIPYGKPIDNCRYYVLDELLQECPDLVPGEMYCAGLSMARGYMDDPKQTTERFLLHPRTGERLYRTGDRGAFRPDGSLLILGRMDFQINAGGYRCDPLEIEMALTTHPDISHAVALELPNEQGGSSIVACYVPVAQPCSEEDLRKMCAAQLPAAAIPRKFVPLSQLPITANGKIDRRALAELVAQSIPNAQADRPPEGATELRLAQIWSVLLSSDVIDAETGFFASGGDSLGATRMLLQIEKDFGVRPPLAVIFSHPSIRALSSWLDENKGATAVGWPVCSSAHPPQSWAQQRLWFMAQLAPTSPFFNLCYCLELDGPLAVEAFKTAVARLVERHEPLRSYFPPDTPHGTYRFNTETFVTTYEDLRHLDPKTLEERLHAQTEQEKTQGFDLAHGPLVRAHLLRTDEHHHLLFYSIHHIAFDGWSADLFNRDLFALYLAETRETASPLPPVARYADFAQSQHDVSAKEIASRVTFWQERLAGLPALRLPEDRPRPAVQSFQGAIGRYRLGKTLTRGVDALSSRQGVTPFMTLLTAMQVALGRLAEQPQFVMGSVVSGRDHPASEAMIGFFINNLLLRADLSDNLSFIQQLTRVRDEFLDAEANQHYPLQQLVQSLSAGADLSRNPLHQVSFTYQPAGLANGRFGQIQVRGQAIVPATTHMDLEVIAIPDGDELMLVWLYAADLYEAATIERWHRAFEQVLHTAIHSPQTRILDLPLANPQDSLDWSCVDGGPALVGLDPWPVLSEHATNRPDRQVLRCDDGTGTSWRSLIDRSEALAGWVMEQSPAGQSIAIRLHPGIDYAAAILAALRLGRAWIPLDPRRPQHAVTQLVRQACAGVLISDTQLWNEASPIEIPYLLVDKTQKIPTVTLPPYEPADDDAIALIQHTSGSQGTPKGVQLSYGGLRRRLAWGLTTAPLTSNDIGCLKTAPAFVDAVGELLDSLLADMVLVVPDPDQARSPYELAKMVRHHRISRLVMTPSLADAFFALPEAQNLPLRVLVLGGENVRADLARRCLGALPEGAFLLNYYGATELTSDGAWCRLLPQDVAADTCSHVSIGQPLPGTRIWLLDSDGRLTIPGMPGEIHVSGQNLATGYTTATPGYSHAFRAWTSPEGEALRLYATGDVAVRDSKGRLRCLGRRDQQLKIRGIRIEAGEIESALRRHQAVRDAVVTTSSEGSQQQLIAHVLVAAKTELSAHMLRDFLAHELPPGLVPSHWDLRHEWPYTATGKVDRHALPRDRLEAPGSTSPFVSAETPLQQSIVDAWQEVLGESRVGIHDNFFEMGGNSLLLAQVHRRICLTAQREFPLTLLFQHPTIHGLANALEGSPAAKQAAQRSSTLRAGARLAAARGRAAR